jgi:hypothetical protein
VESICYFFLDEKVTKKSSRFANLNFPFRTTSPATGPGKFRFAPNRRAAPQGHGWRFGRKVTIMCELICHFFLDEKVTKKSSRFANLNRFLFAHPPPPPGQENGRFAPNRRAYPQGYGWRFGRKVRLCGIDLGFDSNRRDSLHSHGRRFGRNNDFRIHENATLLVRPGWCFHRPGLMAYSRNCVDLICHFFLDEKVTKKSSRFANLNFPFRTTSPATGPGKFRFAPNRRAYPQGYGWRFGRNWNWLDLILVWAKSVG